MRGTFLVFMRGTFLALLAIGSSACFTFVDFDLGETSGPTGGQGGSGAGGLGGEGGCTPALTVCDGFCVDTLADRDHCGACAHACGGGACLGGVCQPVELASFPRMHGLLLDEAGDRVYFATSNFDGPQNTVGEVSTMGGAPTLFSTAGPASSYLALSASRLYWTTWDEGSIRSVSLSQPGKPAVDYKIGLGFGIQVIGDNLHFADFNAGLFRFKTVNGPQTPELVVATTQIRHFVFDDSTDRDPSNDAYVFTTTNSVQRYAVGTGVTTLLAKTELAFDIVQDADYYYFTDEGAGTLHRIPKSSTDQPGTPGRAEVMATGLSAPRGLALDDAYVYVVAGDGVSRFAKLPRFVPTLIAGATTGNAIAVDEHFIYWTNIGSGKLMKIAKPLEVPTP